MFRDYFVFKYNVNGKLALVCKKEDLNQHIDFISSKFKSLNWECYYSEELEELGIET